MDWVSRFGVRVLLWTNDNVREDQTGVKVMVVITGRYTLVCHARAVKQADNHLT